MKRIAIHVWILSFSILPSMLLAQTREITGIVTDENNSPLAAVSVAQKGVNNTTVTNEAGQFRLSVSGTNPILIFSYAGRESRELRVGSENNYSVSLAPAGDLSEVVVTALGIRRQKRELGYSTEEIKTEEITQTRQPNIVNALQGRATGFQINSGGGAPGQGSRIVMRGITSLDPSREFQPLFIVDGVPIDNSTDVTTGGIRGMTNRAADLNPDDIESITILKGGAATALYGSLASTGAIIITTKSGKAGQFRASFSSSYGIENVNKFPKTQKTFTQGYLNAYDSTSFWPSWGPTVAEAKLRDNTHPDELFNNFERGYQQGSFFRNTLNVSGGTDRVTLGASLSQYKHEGVLPFSDYKNYSVKINGDLKFSSKLRVGASANYINSGGNRKNADRYNEQLSYWSPRWDVMNSTKPDGTMNVYGIDNDNPVFVAENRKFIDDVNRVIGNIHFTYTPFSWLELSYRAGADVIGDARTETAPGPTGKTGELYPGDFRNYDRNRALGGFIEEYRNNRRIFNSTAMLTLRKEFTSDLSTSLRLGHDLRDSRMKYVYALGDTLSDPTFFNLSNARKITGSNFLSENRIIGAFGELTTGWKNLIFLTLTGRNDWSSTLPEGNRSFFYPSASLAYILSEHIKVPDWISYAKLRVSSAKIGKAPRPYSFSQGFVPLSPQFQGGLTLSNRSGDPELRPEFTTSSEVGTELRFLGNRLGLDFTYYNNTSKDLIIPVAVTSSTGLNDVFLNAGSIRNKGIELSINAAPVQQADFGWNVRVNYTKNNNKVLEIYPGLTEVNIESQFGYIGATVTQKFIPGMPVGALFGRSYARYYGSGKEDPMFIDYNQPWLIAANGFPVVNTRQMYLGKTQPDWIGSIYNDLYYKQFSLSFLFDTHQGIQKYNQMANFMSAFGIAEYTTNRRETIIFDGVLADGTKNTKPVYLGQGIGPDAFNYGNGYYRNYHRAISENFIEDASFVKLRNVTLAYTLRSASLAKTKIIKGATFSVTGNNLWISTDYSGFDPESSSANSGSITDGFAGFTYPSVRSFMMSINLTF